MGLSSSLPGGIPIAALDTDPTAAANSDAKVMSQKATRDYVAANAGGGGVTNSAVENEVPRTDAAGNLVSSIITDDGTFLTALRAGSVAGILLNDDNGSVKVGDVSAAGNNTYIAVRDGTGTISLNGLPVLTDLSDAPSNIVTPVGWIRIKLNGGPNTNETAWIPYYQ